MPLEPNWFGAQDSYDLGVLMPWRGHTTRVDVAELRLTAGDIDCLRIGLGTAVADDRVIRWLAHLTQDGELNIWHAATCDSVFVASVSPDGIVADVRHCGEHQMLNAAQHFADAVHTSLVHIRRFRADEEESYTAPDQPDFLVRGDLTRLQAWAKNLVPFEPKGWLVDLRSQIRGGLDALHCEAGQFLHATLSSADGGVASDLDNVLNYNIGPRYTRRLMTAGVHLERCFTSGLPVDRLWSYPYRYLFEMAEPEPLSATQDLESARFDDISVPKLTCATIWWAIRQQAHKPSRPRALDLGMPSELRIVVHPPVAAGSSWSLASQVKPLVDGVMCAFHSHRDHGDTVLLVDRLHRSGIGAREAIRAALDDSDWDLFGPTRLVAPWGSGVKWNPADELLYRIVITVGEPVPPGSTGWTMSGTLAPWEG
jgi:hypothetical protein